MPTPDDIALRPATTADISTITAIYGHAVATGTASFELAPPSEADMAARLAHIRDARLPWLVATDGPRVLGYAYAGPWRPRPAYRFTLENSVYVAADARGRGIGRRLLARLIEETTALGARRMIAVIGDSANAASIGLHAALGFEPVGVLPSVGWKHGRWLDTVLMQRPLGPGDTIAPMDVGDDTAAESR